MVARPAEARPAEAAGGGEGDEVARQADGEELGQGASARLRRIDRERLGGR